MRKTLSNLLFVFVTSGLLWGCVTSPRSPGTKPICVLTLQSLSPEMPGRPDLKRVLSAEIGRAIEEKSHLQVLERDALPEAPAASAMASSAAPPAASSEPTLLELEPSASGTRGARELVMGNYEIEGKTLRIALRRVDMQTTQVLKTVGKSTASGELAAWQKAAREAATELYSQ